MRFFHYLAWASLALFLNACNAPRDNPLDSDGDNFVGALLGSIRGKVTNLVNIPVSDALVLTIPGYRGAFTDADGDYFIEGIEAGTYQIFCAPAGFAADTLTRQINSGKQAMADFRLDALPVFQSFQVTSHYVYQPDEPPYEFYTIYARSLLTDLDGVSDLKQPVLEVEGGLDTLMSYNPDSSIASSFFYSVSLPESFFPNFSVDSLRSTHFTCSVEDTSGNGATSSPLAIQRFFLTSTELIYPEPGVSPDIINIPNPTLIWYPYEGYFFFTYEVRIYQQFNNELYWQRSGIASYVDTVTVDKNLEDGYYYWLIEIFDEYGNSSRSQIADFRVLL